MKDQPKSELETSLEAKEQTLLRELEYMKDPNTKDEIVNLIRSYHRGVLEKKDLNDKEEIILRDLEYMDDDKIKEEILTLLRLYHRKRTV